MSAYDLHMAGACWPDNCLMCAQECDACFELMAQCACPTLPLDEDVTA